MKMTLAADGFRRVVNLCQPVAQAGGKPNLKAIKITATAGEDAAVAEATDTEISVRVSVSAEVIHAGHTAISAARLRAVDSVWDEEMIHLEHSDGMLEARGQRMKFRLHELGGSTDPHPGAMAVDLDGGAECVVSVADLRGQISDVSFAAARTASQAFNVAGVQVEIKAGELTLVATDTKRLGLRRRPGGGKPGDATAIVPRKFFEALRVALSDDASEVMIGLTKDGGRIKASLPGVTYAGLTLSGKYPPYEKLISKKPAITVDLPARDFLDRLRAAAITNDAATNRIDLAFSAGQVLLSASDSTEGKSEVRLDLPNYAGPDIEIAADAKFLLEAMRHYADAEGTLRLEMTSADKPMVFRPADGRLHLIMPLAG